MKVLVLKYQLPPKKKLNIVSLDTLMKIEEKTYAKSVKYLFKVEYFYKLNRETEEMNEKLEIKINLNALKEEDWKLPYDIFDDIRRMVTREGFDLDILRDIIAIMVNTFHQYGYTFTFKRNEEEIETEKEVTIKLTAIAQ